MIQVQGYNSWDDSYNVTVDGYDFDVQIDAEARSLSYTDFNNPPVELNEGQVQDVIDACVAYFETYLA